MEIGCAVGALPHEVARWPWRRVQRYWTFLRRKQRREERVKLLLASQQGLGAIGQIFGGGAPARNPDEGLDKTGMKTLRDLGIPVKTVKTEG